MKRTTNFLHSIGTRGPSRQPSPPTHSRKHYAGYHGRAVAQLVITLLLGWLFIGLLITGVWALIEIITVDTDAAGVRKV